MRHGEKEKAVREWPREGEREGGRSERQREPKESVSGLGGGWMRV